MEHKLTENCVVDLNDLFGHGATGQVYRGTITVAIKKICYRRTKGMNKLADPDPKIRKLAETEIRMFQQMGKHKNILQLLDFKDDGKCYWLILEYCDLGDLEQYLEAKDSDLNSKINIMVGCANGLHYMHCGFDPPIVHGDIKPANILLKRQNGEDVVKLSDFSGSGITGTRTYLPPEAYISKLVRRPAGDIFSLGLLYNVLLLYDKDNRTMNPKPCNIDSGSFIRSFGTTMVDAVKHNKTSPLLFPESFGKSNPTLSPLKDMIEEMIRYEHQKRIEITQVVYKLDQITGHRRTVIDLQKELKLARISPSNLYPDKIAKYDRFCMDYAITQNTRDILQKEELNNLADLAEVTDVELRGIHLTLGQTKAILRGIRDIKKIKPVPLDLEEVMCNSQMQIRKCIVKTQEKQLRQTKTLTVLLLGDTGSGKSTLIDRMANYLYYIQWKDKYRIQLIDKTEDEKENAEKGQAFPQTNWITLYSIPKCTKNMLQFNLNIIDTPGFKRFDDNPSHLALEKRLDMLFNSASNIDFPKVDIVCIVERDIGERLCEPKPNHIQTVIQSVFSKELEKNIFTMKTFANLVNSVSEQKLQTKRRIFSFENTNMDPNTETTHSQDTNSNINQQEINQNFWIEAMRNYKEFFNELSSFAC